MRASNVLAISQVAQRLNIPTWCIRRAISRGFLRETSRVGVARIWFESDLPEIEVLL